LSNNKKDEEIKDRNKLEALTEENLLLNEKLQLRRTNWLYSHHLSYSIMLGVFYGFVISLVSNGFFYILKFVPNSEGISAIFSVGLIIFNLLFFPAVSIFLLVFLLKAPRFSFQTIIFFLLSFPFFEWLLLYFNPVIETFFVQSPNSVQLMTLVTIFTGPQTMVAAYALLFVPQFANRCGYRLVLSGSSFSFQVDSDHKTVSKQLSKLGECFKVRQQKSNDPLHLTFTKITRKKKSLLQFFLRPKDGKTVVILFMHSITNDVPLRALRIEVEKIGKPIMKWLEVTTASSVQEIKDKNLLNEINKKSKTSLHDRQLTLPSMRVVKDFFVEHWKEFGIITSILVAILAWIFPR